MMRLTKKQGSDILSNLSADDYKHVITLLDEAILATDLALYVTTPYVSSWSWDGATENASTENESTGGWNMQVPENASTNLQRWKT